MTFAVITDSGVKTCHAKDDQAPHGKSAPVYVLRELRQNDIPTVETRLSSADSRVSRSHVEKLDGAVRAAGHQLRWVDLGSVL